MSDNSDSKTRQVLGLLAVGLDNKDGHKRITKSEEFLLVGGSESTHENMQEMALRFSESLKKKGKRLPETPVEEVIDLLRAAHERNS